jgi:hypothetical protein
MATVCRPTTAALVAGLAIIIAYLQLSLTSDSNTCQLYPQARQQVVEKFGIADASTQFGDFELRGGKLEIANKVIKQRAQEGIAAIRLFILDAFQGKVRGKPFIFIQKRVC